MTLDTREEVVVVTTVASTIHAFLRPHVHALEARGSTVALLCGGSVEELRDLPNLIRQIPLTRSPWQLHRHIAALIALRRSAKIVEAVYVHTPIAAALTRLARMTLPRESRPSVLYFVHGFHFWRKADGSLKGRFWYLLERMLSFQVHTLFVINMTDFEEAQSWRGRFRPARVTLLPGVGVDLERFQPKTGANEDEMLPWAVDNLKTVLMIAETTRNKRHGLALQALTHLPEARLVLVGPGTDSLELSLRIERMGLTGRVVQLGYRQDVAKLLQYADAVMLCSEREGLPQSLVEALVVGTPIAVTPTRGAEDLARFARCPVAVSSSPQDLATAIRQATRDPRPREEIRKDFLSAWPAVDHRRVAADVADAIIASFPADGGFDD